MTDGQPRQLMPQSESHQSLSGKLGVSRPPPPRSRSRGNVTVASSTNSNRNATNLKPTSGDPKISDPENLGSSHDTNPSNPSDASPADLEGRGTASIAHSTFQRSVSNTSNRSQRAISDEYITQDIPKEEIERALQGLARDDLVVALGRAKVQMDEIEARLEEQILENEGMRESHFVLAQKLGTAESEALSHQVAIKQREDRIDDMMADQDRMEGEVYSTMQVIERLRKQLSEAEKTRNDVEKRYIDQSATMDKERQYYADTELLLKSHKATQATAYEKLLSNHSELLKEHERVTNQLASLKSSASSADGLNAIPEQYTSENQLTQATTSDDDNSTHHDADDLILGRVSPNVTNTGHAQSRLLSDERDLAELREELFSTQKSHLSLSETVTTLRAELKDARSENVSLRDQNETFMNILQEKTFSGTLLNESAMLRGLRASSGHYKGADGLMDHYDSDESESELTGNDDGESERNYPSTIPEEDEDDVPDTPKTPRTNNKMPRQRKKSSSTVIPPSDLASELGQVGDADVSSDKSSRLERTSLERTDKLTADDLDEIHTEVRELREANQALTLYISKIIDRIIAKEGYENILAIESRGGTIRGTTRRKASRASLKSVFEPPASSIIVQPSQNASDISNTTTTSSTTGGGFFGFGGSSSSQSSTTADASATKPKGRRGASIDWRNIPFLGGGGNVSAETNASLKPLTLQSSSVLLPPRDGSARKLRTSEEVEDDQDVAERERIRQELANRGIEPPKNQLGPIGIRKPRPQSIAVTPSSTGASGFAAFFSRVVGNGPGSLLSPARSDTMSEASSTPGRTSGSEIGATFSSTPYDREKRHIEQKRALDASTSGGDSLTKYNGSEAIASRTRDPKAGSHQQSLDHATGTSTSRHAQQSSSDSDVQTGSGLTSSAASTAEGSMMENSVAGDESYCLPVHMQNSSRVSPVNEYIGSPLLGYENALPPLPHETTGDEDPDEFRSPTQSQPSQFLNSSQDQGWKKAFRRISTLGSSNAGSAAPSVSSPTGTHHGSDYIQSPISTNDILPFPPAITSTSTTTDSTES